MHTPDPADAPVVRTADLADVPARSTAPPERFAPVGLVRLALAAGLFAGVISWGVEEVQLRYFGVTYRLTREQRVSRSAGDQAIKQEKITVTTRTAMISYGALGGLLGLGLGLVGGRARRSLARGVSAGGLGLVLGGAAGSALSWKLVPYYLHALAAEREALADDIALPFLIHLGLWVGVGVAGGLALGLGMGSWSRGALAVLGGAVGAALGTALYEFVGAVAFSGAETNLPIALGVGPRLLAHLGVAVLAALGAAGAARHLTLARPSRGAA